MIDILLIISAIIILVTFFTSVINLFSAPALKIIPYNHYKNNLVSILIPARNEEKNITECVNRCLNQNYPNKEIVVLDDNSTDNTYSLLTSFGDKIKILKGKELPGGWLGKNWACQQLSEVARGEYLLFIDADVRLETNAVTSAINEMGKSDVVMLSVFPTQIIKTISEWLVVPLMNWLLLSFLPLAFVYKSKHKSFVAANGQFILWNKKSYSEIGGHYSVKDKPVEDMEFARICKSRGFKIKTLLGDDLIECRMYSNLKDAINGFSKNFFPGFNINPVTFLTFTTIISFALLYPIFMINNISYSLPLISMIVLSRIFISIISKQNLLINVLLHPVQMIFVFFIGIISVYKTYTGKLLWKERKLLI